MNCKHGKPVGVHTSANGTRSRCSRCLAEEVMKPGPVLIKCLKEGARNLPATYQATCSAYPDLIVYESTPDLATEVLLEAIEGLQEMARKMGHASPVEPEFQEALYSNRSDYYTEF